MPAATKAAPRPSGYTAPARARQAAAAEQAPSVRVLPRPQTRTRTRAQAAPHLSVRGTLVFLCVTALMLFIVYAYTQMAEMNNASQNLARDISQLQKEGAELLRQKNDLIDLEEIERAAVEDLGMIKPGRSQIIYINLSGEDHAEVIVQGSGPDLEEAQETEEP